MYMKSRFSCVAWEGLLLPTLLLVTRCPPVILGLDPARQSTALARTDMFVIERFSCSACTKALNLACHLFLCCCLRSCFFTGGIGVVLGDDPPNLLAEWGPGVFGRDAVGPRVWAYRLPGYDPSGQHENDLRTKGESPHTSYLLVVVAAATVVALRVGAVAFAAAFVTTILALVTAQTGLVTVS